MKSWFWTLLIFTVTISVFQAGHQGGSRLPIIAVGQSFGVFLTYTIIPFIWWAFYKFRWSKAYGPMLTWTLIMLFFMPLSLYGALHS